MEKSEQVKNVLKKRYGPFGRKLKSDKHLQKVLQSFWVNKWKMSLTSVTVVLEFKIIKTWKDWNNQGLATDHFKMNGDYFEVDDDHCKVTILKWTMNIIKWPF